MGRRCEQRKKPVKDTKIGQYGDLEEEQRGLPFTCIEWEIPGKMKLER